MSSYRPVRAAASRIACGTSEIGPLSLGIFDHSLEEPDDAMRRLLGVAGTVALINSSMFNPYLRGI
jgi:hypothetical protein